MNATFFGKRLKELRQKTGRTLREFCLSNEIDPGNYSRMERGMFPPPQREDILEKYATALGLIRGSDEWIELFDLAAACRGEIPRDLLTDDEVLEKLPVLFRTMRTKKGDNGPDLDDLVEKIRRT